MRALRRTGGAIVTSIIMVAGLTAHAETSVGGDAALTRGRELVRSFEYDAALTELESVLAAPSSSASQRIQALELMALLQMNLRRQAQAQEQFERLLNLDPGHELTDPELPPRAEELFAKTRTGFVPSARTAVEARSSQPVAGGSVDLEAEVGGAAEGVERAVAYVRGPGEASYRRALMIRAGLSFSASVPPPTQGGGTLEYYVEAHAPSGYVLAGAGSAGEPLRAEVVAASDAAVAESPDEEGDDDDGGEAHGRTRTRWYRSWWFWTIVGVAVAGGATATAVVLTQPEEQPHGSLGSLNLP